MTQAWIVAAGRELDGRGNLPEVEGLEQRLRAQGVEPLEFVVDPLAAGWDTPVALRHFRSGCAPVEALAAAREAVCSGRAQAAVVSGEDRLRSDYVHDKARRAELMAIYGPDCPLPEAYTRLAYAFMRLHGLSEPEFRELADGLYANYVRTAERRGEYRRPPDQRFESVTALFRAVDCANPVVDFRGRVLLVSTELAERLFANSARVRVAGVGLARLDGDGPEYADEIARYAHLRTAFDAACREAGVDFGARYRAGEALLEAYTCFPVSPLGLLYASGMVSSAAAVLELLRQREVTVSGGMNIARGPWNNPALNGLVVLYQDLIAGRAALGGLHGNGGLGYRQGFAVLCA